MGVGPPPRSFSIRRTCGAATRALLAKRTQVPRLGLTMQLLKKPGLAAHCILQPTAPNEPNLGSFGNRWPPEIPQSGERDALDLPGLGPAHQPPLLGAGDRLIWPNEPNFRAASKPRKHISHDGLRLERDPADRGKRTQLGIVRRGRRRLRLIESPAGGRETRSRKNRSNARRRPVERRAACCLGAWRRSSAQRLRGPA